MLKLLLGILSADVVNFKIRTLDKNIAAAQPVGRKIVFLKMNIEEK
jgi:hypothetical protein